MQLLLFICKDAIGGILNPSHLGGCSHGRCSWTGVHTHARILKRTRMRRGRWNGCQQHKSETQRNNKVQEACVADLFCLLVVLVEKVLHPACIVWMDCLQFLNLHKPESRMNYNNNIKLDYNTPTHIYTFTAGKKKNRNTGQDLDETTM